MKKSKLFVVLGSIIGIGILAIVLKGRQVKKAPGDLKINNGVDNVDDKEKVCKETHGSFDNNEDIENEILLNTEEGFNGEVLRIFNAKIKNRKDLTTYSAILNELVKESFIEHDFEFVNRMPNNEVELIKLADSLGFRKEIDNIVIESYKM